MKLYRTTAISAKRSFFKMRIPTGVFIIFMLLILGSGGAVIYYFYNQINSQSTTSLQNFSPVTQEPVSLTLNLSSPDDNSLVFSEDLLIQGKASPKTVVILSTNTQDYLLEPNKQGDFSITVKLQEGLNLLSVNAFDNLGNNKSENKTIYYSEEKI